MKVANSKSFPSVLKREVAALASEHGIRKSKAFLVWLAKAALELTDEEALEATTIDGANDKGIDLFFIDKEEGKVIIAQGGADVITISIFSRCSPQNLNDSGGARRHPYHPARSPLNPQ